MKKRYLALLLVLVLALVACNPEATGDATEAPATDAGKRKLPKRRIPVIRKLPKKLKATKPNPPAKEPVPT